MGAAADENIDMADAKEKAADGCAESSKGWLAAFEALGEAASPKLKLAKLNAGCAVPVATAVVLPGRLAVCTHERGHQYDMHPWISVPSQVFHCQLLTISRLEMQP